MEITNFSHYDFHSSLNFNLKNKIKKNLIQNQYLTSLEWSDGN